VTDASPDSAERRVLVLAPTPKDAALTRALLERSHVECVICTGIEQLCERLHEGAAVLLLPEEAIAAGRSRLTRWLAQQPTWSDLPVLILARPGADSAVVAQAMEMLGNVTVLERPTRVAALVSAVRSALRARQRQCQIRDHLAERERADEQLRRSAELLTFLIDRSPAGFYIVDCNFRISHINADSQARAFRNVMPAIGRRLDEAMRILWPEPLATEIINIFRHTLDTGEPYRSPGLISERNDLDAVETYEWQLDRITMPDGTYSVVCYYYDTTRLRQAEDALRQADRRKDEFLATLAHELRNPLAPLRNGLQVMKLAKSDAATIDEVRAMMERQLAQMVRLIDDLLDLSRISRGKIELKLARVELAKAVQQALETSRPSIEKGRHQLVINMAAERIDVLGDITRLSQIFGNLLNNAAKYSDPGGRITLTVERQADEAVVRVRDTGIGIPQAMLPQIFEMFTQIDRSLEKAQGGLGIGLSLVKFLVEMHDGSVAAYSEGLGQGSEFVVRLPAITADCEHDDLDQFDGGIADAAPRRILVVDDNRDAANTLALVLQIMGNETRTAHDGLEALDVAEEFRPDVALLDIGMPKLNGYDAARRLRDEPWGREMVLIALTGWGQEEDRRRSREAGFDFHLVKPVAPADLKSLLASLQRSGLHLPR
jgi:signal transduction histidine kinase/ActR/RegA family two-component response regulator